LELGGEIREKIARWANLGLSKKTWSSYKTAERMLMTCLQQNGRRLELPISRDNILIFIEWLITVRKVKASTIENYLAGVRQLHIVKGMDPPAIKSELVKLVLKGKANSDAIEKRKHSEARRMPITLKVLTLLKECIRRWTASPGEKRLTWAVSTLAFAGSFRIGELLCRSESEFDPDFDLLSEDITVTEDEKGRGKLSVKLKCPKENKTGIETIVDVFQTDNATCPVKAFRKWQENSRGEQGQPAFRQDCGRPLTGKKLNVILKKLLSPHFDYEKGTFTTHSFRSGVPSMMGAAGMSEKDIKAVGRWSSRAYMHYVKKPRVTRIKAARKAAALA